MKSPNLFAAALKRLRSEAALGARTLREANWKPYPLDFYARNRRVAFSSLLLVAGVAWLIWSVLGIESKLFQPPAEFLNLNKRALLQLCCAALAVFLGALGLGRRLVNPAPLPRVTTRPRPTRNKVILKRLIGFTLVVAGGLPCAYTFRQVWHLKPGLDQVLSLFAGITLIIAGLALTECRRRRSIFVDLRLNASRREWVYLGLFLFMWFTLMAYRIESRPGFFHGDEGMIVSYGRATYLTLDGGPASPWGSVFQAYLSSIPRGALFDLMRSRPYLGPRLVTLFVATFGLAAIFFFARAYFGRLGAWIALLFGATHHTWLAFSRMALLNVDGALLITLIVFIWLCAYRARRVSLAFLAGALTGFSYYSYHGALIALPLIACVALLNFLIQPRRILNRWAILLVFATGFVIMAAPHKILYRNNPGGGTFRQNQVSLLATSNFKQALEQSGSPTIAGFLLHRAWPSIGGSLLWPDFSSNYSFSKLPIIDRTLLGLLLAALIAGLPMLRQSKLLFYLVVWIALTLVLGALLTTSPEPPYAPRVFMMFPPIYLLAAWTITTCLRVTEKLWGRAFAIFPLAAAGVLTLHSAAINVKNYEIDYLGDMTNPGYSISPMGLMEFFNTFPPDAHMVLCSTSFYQFHYACLKMFDGPYKKTGITDPEAEAPTPPQSPGGTAYVFKLPEFEQMERKFQARHPGLKPLLIDNPHVDDPPGFAIYWVKAGQTPEPRNQATEPEPTAVKEPNPEQPGMDPPQGEGAAAQP